MLFTVRKGLGSLACAASVLAFSSAPVSGQATPVPNTSTQYTWMQAEAQPAPPTTGAPVEMATPAPIVDTVPPVVSGSCPTCCCAPKKCCCTKKKKEALAKAVGAAHKPLHYLNDFSYINDPCYCDWWPGDRLKQMKLGDCTTVDIGGQYRFRFHGEDNMRNFGPGGGLGLTGADDEFLLHRLRLYTNIKYGDNVRFFGEMLHAVSTFEDLGPRPIEENYWDIQNLFIDIKAGNFLARAGRQEIALGGQRLISPLDWANTRRTFDGGRLIYNNEDWTIDSFWLRPLVRDRDSIDDANEDQSIYGVYSTYKGFDKDTLEAYWLAFDNDAAPFNFQTIGTRYLGSLGDYKVEVEGGYQFGDNPDNTNHDAGFFTAGLGRSFADVTWKPSLWFYYDWASGSGEARGNGFHHFQPLAHKYLGFMDLFGRRNIETPNIQLTFSPHKKWKCMVWWYYFFLENQNDTPYNVVMGPFQPGVAPGSADLGQEIDLTAVYSINARMKFLLGYSHFAPGDYYETPGLAFDGPANFFYAQYHLNF